MSWMNIVQLAASLAIFHCLAVADDRIIVYEAGAADWTTQGSITTRPLADFSCPPGAIFPGTAGDPNPEVFLLTSSSGRLDLRFNGTGISVFGITFPSSSCYEYENPAVAFLDESSPPSSAMFAGPACSALPTPRPVCGMLLARYSELNTEDDHHLFLSTSGAQLGVLNAQVALDGEPPRGSFVTPYAAPTTTTGRHQGDGVGLQGPLVTPEPATTPTTGRLRGDGGDGEPAPDPQAAVTPRPAQTTTIVRHRAPSAVILPAVLVPICLLSFVAGLFLVIRRRRQRANTSHIEPLPFMPVSPPRLVKSANSPPPPAEQLPASIAPPDAVALERAIAAAGITPHELVVSLNRQLGEQARVESPRTSGGAPPRYEG